MALDPEKLRPHYRHFLPETSPPKLLTGHSHQAWPDVARDAMLEAFDVAAKLVDDKWQEVFLAQDEVRSALAAHLGGSLREYAFASNTHELVVRFLSALDLKKRPHLVTTTGEFHSARRQLRRLEEEGIRVSWVDAHPVRTLAERVSREIRPNTAATILSTVLFETSEVVPHLEAVTEAAHAHGALPLFDAYHAFFALPFRLRDLGPDPLFVTAGGYKYAEWGEGMCFLRVPPGLSLRPAYTGWFAGFAELDERPKAGIVGYPADGGNAFAGSTFDPTSTFRARAVVRHFARMGMTPEALRALSLRQTRRLITGCANLPGVTLRTPEEDAARGGFVALQTEKAAHLVRQLRADRIFADHRGDLLRLGPAPYVTDGDIDETVAALRRHITY